MSNIPEKFILEATDIVSCRFRAIQFVDRPLDRAFDWTPDELIKETAARLASEARNRELEAKAHCVENIEDIVRRKNKFADECERLEAERDQLREQLEYTNKCRLEAEQGMSGYAEQCKELREQRDKLLEALEEIDKLPLIVAGATAKAIARAAIKASLMEAVGASEARNRELEQERDQLREQLAQQFNAAKQFSEAVVRLTEQRDKLLIALGKIRRINCPDCDSPEIADAAIKAAALPATQEGEK